MDPEGKECKPDAFMLVSWFTGRQGGCWMSRLQSPFSDGLLFGLISLDQSSKAYTATIPTGATLDRQEQ